MSKGGYITKVPETISNLVAWYDAADSSTIDNSSVSSWKDKSYLTNEVIQGTGSDQPTSGSSTIGQLNAIYFDSTSGTVGEFLNRSQALSTSLDFQGKECNIFIVAEIVSTNPLSGSSGRLIFKQASGTTSNAQYDISHIGGGMIQFIVNNAAGTNLTVNSLAQSLNTPLLLELRHNSSDAKVYFNVNADAQLETALVGGFPAGDGAGGFNIGRQKPGFPSRCFDGPIGEVVMYDKLLSSSERLSVRRYLSNKWDIAI